MAPRTSQQALECPRIEGSLNHREIGRPCATPLHHAGEGGPREQHAAALGAEVDRMFVVDHRLRERVLADGACGCVGSVAEDADAVGAFRFCLGKLKAPQWAHLK
ncbi:MAG: hypothetical protein ABIS06_10860 [Vicinamibacterales bacterium]